jgi:hypothetical protein
VLKRFWKYVNKTDSCWLWTGWQSEYGYGKFQRDDGAKVMAHRFAYEEVKGPIPEGLVLDHLCRVQTCVNPEHLEPVTNAENILRGESPSAKNARRSLCIRGHRLTPRKGTSWRECKTCLSRWHAERSKRRVRTKTKERAQ